MTLTPIVTTSEPSSLVQVNDQCSAIEAWADHCDSVPELRDASHKLAAIDEYLSRTSTEGRARVAAALRRLEVRIGKLLGPPPGAGARTDITPASMNAGVHRNQAAEFREMAEHPDVVERVIADSTDEQPASRRRVQAAIKVKKQTEWKPAKPDLGNGISHPARFSPELIAEFRGLLHKHHVPAGARILDPFAGTGRVHELHPEFDTVGVEIQKRWADMHDRTVTGDAHDLVGLFDVETFDAIVTSPTYGNRLADSHNASDPERRRSYTHDLGEDLDPNNSGSLHWRNGTQGSVAYRTFHEKAWDEAALVLKPGGLFLLNIKDHIRGGQLMPVSNWHSWCLGRLGLDYVDSLSVPASDLRQGTNGDLRHSFELVLVFGKPS